MDSMTHYRNCIEQILQEYSQYRPSYGDVETEMVIDPVRDHYHLLSVGWNRERRVHGVLLHIDIRNQKIWIQHDGTEEGVANKLVEMGVPKMDIVLAFHPPYKRPYTGFGTD